ncbi:MAG: helix-turn-helix domain-containing protein [Eubacterium sp.]
MDFSGMINIKVLPSEVAKSFLEGESVPHLSYKSERKIFECVKQGDIKSLFNAIKQFDSIGVGKLSENDLKQYKYMAISVITLAVRYAIEGGLSEEDCYTFSDLFIQDIDAMATTPEIISAMAEGIIKLTNSVADEKKRIKHSPYIRKCIAYINSSLSKRITVSELAEVCGISGDYLSHLFKKEMGENISEYILGKKLEAAETMLLDGTDNSSICYALGFSSQSHFITAFKKKNKLTPKEFVIKYK